MNACDIIKQFEGCRLEAYQDVVGVWTIGYGCTHGVVPGETISQADAEELLEACVEQLERSIGHLVTVPLSSNQLAAVTSFTYNVGIGNLGKSTLLSRLNARDYGGAADEFLRWNKAGGEVVPGLTRRREMERQLFLTEEEV